MKFKLLGRVALLACVSVAMVCVLTSCATSTLGYLFATSAQYGQVASMRLDINTGQIKSVRCNNGNGDQGNCVPSSGGSYPTKIVLANGDTLMYVLNAAANGNAASISLLTIGASGSVYNTGQSYVSYGQDPVDMYLAPTGNFLYVLDQYQPADVSGCANPTPATCKGDITAFSIDGKGNLTPIACTQKDGGCLNGGATTDGDVFPINYEPGPLNSGYGGSRMIAINTTFLVLDESTPDVSSMNLGMPEIHTLTIGSDGGLQQTTPATSTLPGAKQLSSIVAAGTTLYISDYQTGQIWVDILSGGVLSNPSFVCPSTLVQPGTACTVNPGSNAGKNVALDAMITVGTYLYAADYANNTVFAMEATTSGLLLQATNGGSNTPLGTNTTCLTLSSSPEFIYAAGNGTVAGEQINTSTGGLSTNLHPTTSVMLTQAVPCLVFSSRN